MASIKLFMGAISYGITAAAALNFHGCSIIEVCTNTILATSYVQALNSALLPLAAVINVCRSYYPNVQSHYHNL